MRRPAVATALLAWHLTASAAPAPAAPTRVRLSYRAPEGCPGEAAFLDAIAAQARPFQRAPRSAARIRSLEAAVSRHKGGFAGELRVREADGSASSREVSGVTCAEVASALALVAALAIDTGPPPPSPPPAEEPPPPPSPKPGWSWSSAVHGGAFFAMAPSPAWGIFPSFEAAPPLERVPLTLDLGAALAASPRAETPAGTAEFLWFAARLGIGIKALRRGPFSLVPALDVGVGLVRGLGGSIATPRDQTRPWVDAGARARMQVKLLPWLAIEAQGGLFVPITRLRWVFDNPSIVVHQTPPVGGYVTAGLRLALAGPI